ncbi:MAG: LytR family transcriptional regulator [Patescibacteria group bacterium]|nr:LytR family transcriptional regulator [Patescibacteria group bacterium]
MDNFRRPKRSKRGFAIDGMLRSPRPSGGVGDFHRKPVPTVTRRQQPERRPQLGNFKQTDGFKASAQPTLPSATPFKKAVDKQLAEEPVQKKKRGLHRRSKADRKARRSQHKWRTLAKRTSLALMVLVLVGGGFVGAKAYMKSRKVLQGGGSAVALQENVDPSQLKVEGDGRINILLLGRGGDGHEGPDLTDTLLVASIDPISKEAGLVSIPRDMWVKPAGASYTKINAVYANAKYKVQDGKKIPNQAQEAEKAGQAAIEKTVEDTLGIPIHYHVMVDFEAFRKSIDTVGGVDINVKNQLYDPSVAWENNWNPLIAAVGQQKFNGNKALLYVRSRHGSARGDFDRAERQREMLVALKDKVLSLGTFGNPVKVSQLLDAFGDHVETNFGSGEVMKLYNIAKQIPSNKVVSVGLADPPNDFITTDMVAGQSVVVPKAGIGDYAAIQSYIRNTLKDSYIKDENAAILVFNGTNKAGLATTKANLLKSYGYNVGEVADAPTKDYTKTQLIDLRDGKKKYTKHYLQKRLGVNATTKLPEGINPGTADFVIVLGQQTE